MFMASCVPQLAIAAVTISEIAWMGSGNSANHEWIELHNDGAAQNVDGWVLSDSMNLSIGLAGVIPANSYVVLERTSDVSAPGLAFLIYTGALVNSGATMRLENENGSLVDMVSGGDDWENIGGDNVTKETAQYSGGGWITAVASPGNPAPDVSSIEQENEPDENISENVIVKSSSGPSGSNELTLPDVTLALDVDAPKTGYVNQAIEFTSEATGVGDTILDSLSYSWNFGDGFSGLGSETEHIFEYPGTYVVTVLAEYKRQRQIARHEITVLPVKMSITKNQSGDIQLNNDSPYEVDISGYVVKGHHDFTFPDLSFLLPNQTITIPKEYVTNSESVMIGVYDSMRSLVTSDILRNDSLPIVQQQVPLLPTPQISTTNVSRATVPSADSFTFTQSENKEIQNEETVLEKAFAEESQVANTQYSGDLPENWSYLGLMMLILLGIGGVYFIPQRNETG